MRKLNNLLKIAFLICLNVACNSTPPKLADQPQCTPYFVFQNDGDRRVLDEDESACICRSYRWDKGFVGPVGQTTEHDIMDCNKLVGHPPDSWLEVANWYEEMRVWLNKESRRR